MYTVVRDRIRYRFRPRAMYAGRKSSCGVLQGMYGYVSMRRITSYPQWLTPMSCTVESMMRSVLTISMASPSLGANNPLEWQIQQTSFRFRPGSAHTELAL